jgi:hypothetical protein
MITTPVMRPKAPPTAIFLVLSLGSSTKAKEESPIRAPPIPVPKRVRAFFLVALRVSSKKLLVCA